MTENKLNILTVDESRAGETLKVESAKDVVGAPASIEAYVDDDGTVRQESNGACFNADAYEVK